MAGWDLHRRDVLRLIGAGVGVLAFAPRLDFADTPVGFQQLHR